MVQIDQNSASVAQENQVDLVLHEQSSRLEAGRRNSLAVGLMAMAHKLFPTKIATY